MNKWAQKQRGFTIVELLIVVVVIAVLAAITIVAYNGIANNAKESALKSDLVSAAKQLQVAKIQAGEYPSTTGNIQKATSTTFQYAYDNTAVTFCVTATSSTLPGKAFSITQGGTVQTGACPGHTSGTPIADGAAIQTITTANCPATRTRAVDARDNRTYFVQKLADGKCWMLTNLAYAGGGTNTYGDVRTLSISTNTTYTDSRRYIHAAASPTTEPTQPSTNTLGGGSGSERQYGYHYNWCAALGIQLGTSACSNAITPLHDPNLSVCPAGWKVPSASVSGDYATLLTALGVTSNAAGSTTLRTVWLAQYAGYSGYAGNGNTFNEQGTSGRYLTSTMVDGPRPYHLFINDNAVQITGTGTLKETGSSLRCLAI